MIAIHYGKSMELPLTNQYKGILPPINVSVHPVDAILMPKARATNWQRWYQMVYYQSRKASRSRSETAWGGWSDQIRNKRIFQSVNCLTTTWHDTAHFLVILFISLKAVWCSLRLVSPRDRAQQGMTECFEPAEMLLMWRNVPLDEPHDLPDSPYE